MSIDWNDPKMTGAQPAVIHPNVTGFVVGWPQPTIADLTARLAAAYAATSAALTELALGNGPSLEAYDRGIAEGERRATAALVDWLRSRGDCQSADDEIAAWLQLQKGNPQ